MGWNHQPAENKSGITPRSFSIPDACLPGHSGWTELPWLGGAKIGGPSGWHFPSKNPRKWTNDFSFTACWMYTIQRDISGCFRCPPKTGLIKFLDFPTKGMQANQHISFCLGRFWHHVSLQLAGCLTFLPQNKGIKENSLLIYHQRDDKRREDHWGSIHFSMNNELSQFFFGGIFQPMDCLLQVADAQDPCSWNLNGSGVAWVGKKGSSWMEHGIW